MGEEGQGVGLPPFLHHVWVVFLMLGEGRGQAREREGVCGTCRWCGWIGLGEAWDRGWGGRGSGKHRCERLKCGGVDWAG